MQIEQSKSGATLADRCSHVCVCVKQHKNRESRFDQNVCSVIAILCEMAISLLNLFPFFIFVHRPK